jgi:flagellar basal body-associated protein FliL
MSTKKQLRLERQRKKQEEVAKTRKAPVWIFILSIAGTLLALVLIAMFLGDNPEPPWPGATWSAAHAHWH